MKGNIFLAPQPSSAMTFLMRKCEDVKLGYNGEWFYFRPQPNCPNEILDFGTIEKPHVLTTGDPREIVFVAQMPHMRDNKQLEYSPWFQMVIGLLSVEVEYSTGTQWTMGMLRILCPDYK